MKRDSTCGNTSHERKDGFVTILVEGGLVVKAFALEASRLGSFLNRVKPKTLKMVFAVTLAKRSAIKCSAEDEMNRE